ncbi:hypothetical protein HHK36_004389 [Tetracentron sinense]|uniref:Auxin response factor n=1 Tax=Tetracentron sinense TaxID=13715 RepID=A0A834ZQU1_TETSI|nr:hypothetical protein HHK36_004389 [Tetracentron sinense]
MASSVAKEPSSVLDPDIWKACAGKSVQIPAVNSRVYYFPQGHAEHSSSTLDLSSLFCSKPSVLCRVVSIQFLADPGSDEVFAKICLEPDAGGFYTFQAPIGVISDEEGENVVSFVKVLTPSDANNGGGFSVPKFCADLIFPPLNFKADPPLQTLSLIDVHGVVWKFRHIYRGTPRRHLLTTGWTKFVNHKMLVAGDSVVFMKNRSGELFVGIRRAKQSRGIGDCGAWNCEIAGVAVNVEKGFGSGDNFSRGSRSRVSAESIVGAAELAAANKPFDVVYYPRIGSPDFMVKAEMVRDSLRIVWKEGMRVKMAIETEDSSKLNWYQGEVSSVMVPRHGPWHGSPWGMLQQSKDEATNSEAVGMEFPLGEELEVQGGGQPPLPIGPSLVLPEAPAETVSADTAIYLMAQISEVEAGWMGMYFVSCRMTLMRIKVTWDAPDVMQHIKSVSPWQVELIPPSPFLPTKKLKVCHNRQLLTDGKGDLLIPMTGLINSTIGNLSPSLSNFKTFPAGMQGARHDPSCISSLSNFVVDYTHHMNADNISDDNMAQKLNSVPTELNIGSTSQSDYSSPQSQISVHFFGTEPFGNRTCSSSTKAGIRPFQLFGKVIQMECPVESVFDNVGCKEDDGSKGSKVDEENGFHDVGCKEDDGSKGSKENEDEKLNKYRYFRIGFIVMNCLCQFSEVGIELPGLDTYNFRAIKHQMSVFKIDDWQNISSI